jgi:phospholipid/cholesterol/gamma-HCH transport system substrate-binding protein
VIIDPSGRGPSLLRLTVTGICAMLVAALVLYLLMLRYTGFFTDKVDVTAEMTNTGDGLPALADVKFRGIIVGAVSSVDIVDRGASQRVGIAIEPDYAERMPTDVTARIIPSNIFGVTAIELVANGSDTTGLQDGATVAQDTSRGTTQLQTTLTTLRSVLMEMQPEKLGRVLGTLADALDSNARVPGSTIERLDTWLTTIDAAIPDLGTMLGDFGKATAGLEESAPELIDVLGTSVRSAATLVERRTSLIALLAGSEATLDTVNALFARSPDAGKELVVGTDQLFGTIAEDPDAISETAANLNTALARLATVFNWGPKRQMVWSVDLTLTPFQQYTAKDCPRYAELGGPRCGGSTVPTVAPPQQYPNSLLPKRLDSAGPILPVIPGLTGPAAVHELTGRIPTLTELLLLVPSLTGGSVQPPAEGTN